MDSPYVVEETADFAVVFKPPKMHCAPLAKKEGGSLLDATLLDWYKEVGKYAPQSPSAINLMHRLDFETHGLVLLAKNVKSFECFRSLQEKGEFVKEYSAVCEHSVSANDGFPPPPDFSNYEPSPEKPLVIESWFRPYGPGRKIVRPVIDDGKKHKEIAKDKGGFYRTEIIGRDRNVFTVRIKRGFRHQIRCHLSWIGFPIQKDPLYNEQLIMNNEQREERSEMGMLALRSCALFFNDPSSGEKREYRIASLFSI